MLRKDLSYCFPNLHFTIQFGPAKHCQHNSQREKFHSLEYFWASILLICKKIGLECSTPKEPFFLFLFIPNETFLDCAKVGSA